MSGLPVSVCPAIVSPGSTSGASKLAMVHYLTDCSGAPCGVRGGGRLLVGDALVDVDGRLDDLVGVRSREVLDGGAALCAVAVWPPVSQTARARCMVGTTRVARAPRVFLRAFPVARCSAGSCLVLRCVPAGVGQAQQQTVTIKCSLD